MTWEVRAVKVVLRLGSGPILWDKFPVCAFPYAIKTRRISVGVSDRPSFCLTNDSTKTTEDATIGDADEVPEKLFVYF